jgi:DNA invertase Pin-like site-specific DNA recombinase
MLIILGGLAGFEHTLIRARSGEGRERAKARGVRFGGQSSLLMPRRPRRILLHTNHI